MKSFNFRLNVFFKKTTWFKKVLNLWQVFFKVNIHIINIMLQLDSLLDSFDLEKLKIMLLTVIYS